MKKTTRSALLRQARTFGLALLVCGTAQAQPAVLYTYSTIDALLAGSYDGLQTVGQLRSHGDFGIGTFNGLDGELVAVDGAFWHVRSDGSLRLAQEGEQVPLAYVTRFAPTAELKLDPCQEGLTALEATIDGQLPNHNLNEFYAVRLHGEVGGVTSRAIPIQHRPYKSLIEASKQQVLFNRQNISGTFVGLRSPAFSKGVSVPGWHWHFVSDDRRFGGHVLSASHICGSAQLMPISSLALDLPETTDFANADQNRDRAQELHQVETLRTPAKN